jgi:hypothetical protein
MTHTTLDHPLVTLHDAWLGKLDQAGVDKRLDNIPLVAIALFVGRQVLGVVAQYGAWAEVQRLYTRSSLNDYIDSRVHKSFQLWQ